MIDNRNPGRNRIYREIKASIVSSVYRMGEKLEAPKLADRYNTSVTPVREALFRLMGEGLVRSASDGGFQVQPMTHKRLRDTYHFNRDLLLMSLPRRIRGEAGRPTPAGPAEHIMEDGERDAMASAFNVIFARSENMQIVLVGRHLNELLAATRAVEPLVLSRVEQETLEIAEHLRNEDLISLRRFIKTYHHRRLTKAAQIVAELAAQSLE
ncbi:GntR family transcriptional regulator [Sphingobium phenoxybenzoativorans]|uniref:GntR family transcriptional regulator n=1 Tax=Sphingobium phenoxybenzoativorans TaxID=1592790 RepID=UPI0009F5BB6D|nr:GntR family transcriptional regulator [Sphingobium phenoxybenzoativorans]